VTNYFKSNFWATTYWEGDQYWRPKVPVPVPVVPVPAGGGGGGVWPASRMACENPEYYAEFIKDRMEWICKPKPKKLGKEHERLPKKQLSPEAQLKWEIHSLKEKIRGLNDEIKRLNEAVQSSESTMFIEFRRQIKLLRMLLQKVKRASRRFSKEPSILAEMIRKSIEEATKKPAVPEAVPQPVPEPKPVAAPQPQVVSVADLQETSGSVYQGVMGALPWALGSTLAAICTYQLVPDEKRWMKTVGYSSTAILGAIAIWRGFSAYSEK